MENNNMKKIENRYDTNTIVLVSCRDNKELIGLYLYQYSTEGTEDLSWHGSPWYEEFYHCIDPKTNEIVVFGNQHYDIHDAFSVITLMQEKIKSAIDTLNYAKYL